MGVWTPASLPAVGDKIPVAFPDAFGAWSTYTPATTNLTIGNGSLAGRYTQVGKLVVFQVSFILGSTSAVAASPTIEAPVTSANTFRFHALTGTVFWDNSATQQYFGHGTLLGNSKTIALFGNNSGVFGGVNNTTPFTWATSDEINVSGMYEAA